MGLVRKNESEKRLAAGRADHGTAIARLVEIDAGETAALVDGAAYAKWREERAAVVAEIERLERLIAALEAGAEAARAHDEAEAKRKRLAVARTDAHDLVTRTKVDGSRIATELLQLLKDVAQQTLVAKALNADLPPGEAPIPTAGILARDAGALPREDLRSREVELWVIAGTGAIVGDQSAVISSDGVTGQLSVGFGSMRPKCLKRRFLEVEYLPGQVFDWPGALFAAVRLPNFTGPGFAFDGSTMIVEQVAALDVDETMKPAKKPRRSPRVELTPLDPWPPADAAPGEADRNVA